MNFYDYIRDVAASGGPHSHVAQDLLDDEDARSPMHEGPAATFCYLEDYPACSRALELYIEIYERYVQLGYGEPHPSWEW